MTRVMFPFVLALTRVMAWIGGAVLAVLIVLTCLSILGRALGDLSHATAIETVAPWLAQALRASAVGPIPGDFELVEAGMAFVIFAFLPICQISGGHASVDIFTARLPDAADRWLRFVIDTVFAAILVLIAVQLGQGALGKAASGQTSFLLQFPVWWGYVLALTGACAAALVGVYLALMRLVSLFAGRDLISHAMRGAA